MVLKLALQRQICHWDFSEGPWEQSLSDLDKLRQAGALRINPYPGQTVAPASPELPFRADLDG